MRVSRHHGCRQRKHGMHAGVLAGDAIGGAYSKERRLEVDC